ncbi:MAG: Hsp20/alpha crystallin family protein [Candidatus Buchananbacteria bacterium]|nr:Hsp20/alpha crystallin family protein [Candidatus Buchananbacteria bacterium]
MPIIKWTPFLEPFEEMEKFISDHGASGFAPAIDVYETKDNVVVEAPLAGIDPKDVEISIENDVLTIKGKVKRESEVDDKNYYRKEIRSGSFFRSVALPAHVVSADAEAESIEGLLKITIPKAPEAKPKTIKVKVAPPKDKK